MIYRKLTEDEVLRLKSQSCLADDWGKVTVAEAFSTEYVHHTRFSGEVRLGVFQSEFTLPGGIKKHSGLRHVTLHNVTVGDNCCIENIQNYIANYEIGHDTFIENVDIMLVDGVSKFGNGVEVSVLNEMGGREVLINDKLSAHQAYILALYRHRPGTDCADEGNHRLLFQQACVCNRYYRQPCDDTQYRFHQERAHRRLLPYLRYLPPVQREHQ